MLLLHGFGDTPQTLRYLAERIQSAGFHVHAPLYPGHGSTTEEFFSSTADEWIASAAQARDALAVHCATISIVGLSMGAAIGAILAAESEISSLVLIAPYLRIPLWARLALRVRPLWDPVVGEIESRHPLSIQNPEERAKSLAYGVTSGRAMAQLARVVRLARASLSRVHSPTLVIQSRNDPRVSVAAASAVLKNLGAEHKRILLTKSGGHVMTVDYGREKVFSATIDWISKWSGQPNL